MDTLGKIRRWRHRDGESIRKIAKKTSLSRNTVRKYLRDESAEPRYRGRRVPTKLDRFSAQLRQWLEEDAKLPRKQRRSGVRLCEALQALGYEGSYGRVVAFIRRWEQEAGRGQTVFIPLKFAPGEAFQFDWSEEQVVLAGQLVRLKAAHIRLCFSRKFLVVCYLTEAHEMLFDAHWRAFCDWGGVTRRGIYDNMSTAVTKVGRGKERVFNRRFLSMASHYLFEPEACNVAAGWEKGQVENQVGNVREWLFVPRRKADSLAALNAELAAECERLARERHHPERQEATIAEVFAAEQVALGPPPVPFDGFAEKLCRVSPSALVHFDRNRYSVPAAFVGHTVSLRAYAERIKILAEDRLIAEHGRDFGRGQTRYDPWHYLPALERKPGALRNGAPFVDWDLPKPVKRLQDRLLKLPGGDRQFVTILTQVPGDGLEAVSVACELALEAGAINAGYVLNVLNRLKQRTRTEAIATPEGLKLKEEPEANMARYDQLLSVKKLALFLLAAIGDPLWGVRHAAQ
jgi:transposase